jgi:hypothetical protein
MNTDPLLAHARARFDHAAARRVLQEKYQARMLFAHAGGMWRAGPELLVLLQSSTEPTLVLADQYNAPVRVNRAELSQLAHQLWQEQMNAWLTEYQQVQQQR